MGYVRCQTGGHMAFLVANPSPLEYAGGLDLTQESCLREGTLRPLRRRGCNYAGALTFCLKWYAWLAACADGGEDELAGKRRRRALRVWGLQLYTLHGVRHCLRVAAGSVHVELHIQTIYTPRCPLREGWQRPVPIPTWLVSPTGA